MFGQFDKIAKNIEETDQSAQDLNSILQVSRMALL